MNPTILTTLSILIVSLTTYFPLAFTENIYDTDGKPLVPGKSYYILPTNTSEGGGLIINAESEEREKCPLAVNQKYCKNDDGFPVIFNVTNGGGDVISEESKLEIEFLEDKKLPDCAESIKWLAVEDYTRFSTIWITIGSLKDLDNINLVHNGAFKIKKQGLGYKLVFFEAYYEVDYDIKRFNDANGRRLVANQFDRDYHPFEVKFVNANRQGRSVV